MVDYQFLKFIIDYCANLEINLNAKKVLDFISANNLFNGVNIEVETEEDQVIFVIERLEIVVSYDFVLILYNSTGDKIIDSTHTENIEEIYKELLEIEIN